MATSESLVMARDAQIFVNRPKGDRSTGGRSPGLGTQLCETNPIFRVCGLKIGVGLKNKANLPRRDRIPVAPAWRPGDWERACQCAGRLVCCAVQLRRGNGMLINDYGKMR